MKIEGIDWFDYQLEAFEQWAGLPEQKRICLYYRTGAGKTLTSLALLAQDGHREALVIAPPATHLAWMNSAAKVGITVTTISHAKFRQVSYRVSRTVPIIADEFHLFGGHKGKGWQKLERTARGLKAPMVLASATPNYNDAERVYCIQSILEPHSTKGGYLQFLYQNCITRQNPFGVEPLVDGFLHYPNAAAYLSSLKQVAYLPDNNVLEPIDVLFQIPMPSEYETYGLDRERKRIVASQMEDLHRRKHLRRVEDNKVREEILRTIVPFIESAETPVLVFSESAKLATILADSLANAKLDVRLVTGKTTPSMKTKLIESFKDGDFDVLVGTSTLATGVDGLDKMCDSLVIFDDTPDDALRRQLMGRILPRGADSDLQLKVVMRYTFTD